MPLLLLFLASQAFAGPQTIVIDEPTGFDLHAANIVMVTWERGSPKVVIPASTSDATDFFETEALPMGRFENDGAWHFAFPTGSRVSAPWAELVLFPESRAAKAVVCEGGASIVYRLVPGTHDGRPAFDLRLDPRYRENSTSSGICSAGAAP